MKFLHHLLLAVLVLTSSRLVSAAEDSDHLTYDKFITEVDAGLVKSVNLDRYLSITGKHVVDGKERPFTSYGHTGSANDVLLTRLLKDKSVPMALKEEKDGPSFWPGGLSMLLVFLVPMATLVLTFRINSKLNRLRQETSAPPVQPS